MGQAAPDLRPFHHVRGGPGKIRALAKDHQSPPHLVTLITLVTLRPRWPTWSLVASPAVPGDALLVLATEAVLAAALVAVLAEREGNGDAAGVGWALVVIACGLEWKDRLSCNSAHPTFCGR